MNESGLDEMDESPSFLLCYFFYKGVRGSWVDCDRLTVDKQKRTDSRKGEGFKVPIEEGPTHAWVVRPPFPRSIRLVGVSLLAFLSLLCLVRLHGLGTSSQYLTGHLTCLDLEQLSSSVGINSLYTLYSSFCF